jgi:two-component system, sensor histidine kinase
MLRAVNRSVRRKLMLVVLATTFAALLVTAIAMLIYDLRTYQRSWVNDLVTQADLLGRASAPALAFDDPAAARENLALLRVRPKITAAAIYEPNGTLFATYVRSDSGDARLPSLPEADGHRIEGNQLMVFHRVVENDEILGTVYLRARYELWERLQDYLKILGAVMIVSLGVALLVSAWLQAAVTKPILSVTEIARNVMERRDFSRRAEKTTDDEIGVLVDAFNDMLAEVARRAEALEASNRTLQHEMHERRGAEEALRAADRRKDEFLATLAHELRNPLAPLRNALQILHRTGGDTAAARQAREMMERQLQQMVRLVDDLLDVSRITTGKLALQLARVELQDVVRNALDTVRPLMEDRGHALSVELPTQPVYARADATRLAQVFSNLLNNAAKYTDPGGRIRFTAMLDRGDVVVTVADSGIGISEQMLPAIFDMFTQVDNSLERSHAGLGVGLSLAKRLIELHGGKLEARSRGLGFGSEFVVRMPALSDAPVAFAAQAAAEPAGSSAHHRILLADDNVDFATSLASLLRSMGNEVRVTHDGSQALETAQEFDPDFAFLDIGLPKINGYDLARRLRERPAAGRMVLVAVTGWGQEKDRRMAHEAGFDHHMVKPVEFDEIQAILKSAWPQR